jgi:hypothetical protein
MLTGELPAKLTEPPSKKVAIDVRLDEVVLRALEKDPQRRYQHVSEVKTRMETIASSPPTTHTGPSIRLRAPLKTSRGFYTTPERLAAVSGSFFWRKSTAELALYDDQMVFTEGWRRTEIPFASVQELGLAREPRWASPVGYQFLSVSYVEQGQRKTLLFLPGSFWFRTAGDTRRYAAEWIVAIRDTVKAATGTDVSCRTEHVTVVSTSWVMLLVFVPLLVIAVLLGSMMLLWTSSPQWPEITVPARAVPRMVVPQKEPWHTDFLEERKLGPSPKKE